jgi:hypothetical protein
MVDSSDKKWKKKTAINNLARLIESEYMALPTERRAQLVGHARSLRSTIESAATPEIGPALGRIGKSLLRAAIYNGPALLSNSGKVWKAINEALEVLAPTVFSEMKGGGSDA